MKTKNIFKVTGTTITTWIDGRPTRTPGTFQTIKAELETETLEQAKEIAADFPKSYKVKVGCLATGTSTRGYIEIIARLTSDDTNGGKNETGINRFRKFLNKASHTFDQSSCLNHATPEELKSLLG